MTATVRPIIASEQLAHFHACANDVIRSWLRQLRLKLKFAADIRTSLSQGYVAKCRQVVSHIFLRGGEGKEWTVGQCDTDAWGASAYVTVHTAYRKMTAAKMVFVIDLFFFEGGSKARI